MSLDGIMRYGQTNGLATARLGARVLGGRRATSIRSSKQVIYLAAKSRVIDALSPNFRFLR